MKVEFDTNSNTMKASMYDHGAFGPAVQFPYKEDEYFHVDEIQKLSLAEAADGTRFIICLLYTSICSLEVMAFPIPMRDR